LEHDPSLARPCQTALDYRVKPGNDEGSAFSGLKRSIKAATAARRFCADAHRLLRSGTFLRTSVRE
jgi:hypothetical protein